MEQVDHDEANDQGGHQRLEDGDDNHLFAVALQRFQAEVFAHAKGDEAEGHVGDEVHALDHGIGDQVQQIGPDEHAGQNVAGDVGQMEQVGDAGHDEACQQHDGQAEYHAAPSGFQEMSDHKRGPLSAFEYCAAARVFAAPQNGNCTAAPAP